MIPSVEEPPDSETVHILTTDPSGQKMSIDTGKTIFADFMAVRAKI